MKKKIIYIFCSNDHSVVTQPHFENTLYNRVEVPTMIPKYHPNEQWTFVFTIFFFFSYFLAFKWNNNNVNNNVWQRNIQWNLVRNWSRILSSFVDSNFEKQISWKTNHRQIPIKIKWCSSELDCSRWKCNQKLFNYRNKQFMQWHNYSEQTHREMNK